MIKQFVGTLRSVKYHLLFLAALMAYPIWSVSLEAQAASPAPVNLRAVTGGENIALLWNPAPGSSPKSYKLYRNGAAIATVAPSPAGSYTNTTRYIDTGVSSGKTYSYQVSMTNTDNEVSPLSAAIQATRPLNGTTSRAPSVTVTTSPTGTDLLSFMNQQKTLIQRWYPKFADALAYPAYTPPTSLTITTAPNTGAAAYATGTKIVVDEGWLRANLNAPRPNVDGAFLHEMTHIIQQYPNGPSWVAEGVAVWATHNIFNDGDTPFPSSPTAYYLNGYDNAAYMIKWASTTFNKPNLARDLNIAARNGTYTDSFWIAQTGKSPHDLWLQMTGKDVQALKYVGVASGRCIDVPYANNANDTQMTLGNCWSHPAQTFTFFPIQPGDTMGRYQVMGKCLDTRGQGLTNGTPVVLANCNSNATQVWQYNPVLKELIQNMSFKCVHPVGDGTADKTPLEIRDCAASPSYDWTEERL